MFESPKMQRAVQRPVSWVNIPITRTVNNIMANVVEELQQQQQQPQHHQSPKRVRWSQELTQVRDISPRYKASPFRFISPNRSQRSASPSRSSSVSRSSSSSSSRPSKSSITSTTQLHCSPQLQKVVFRAVNNNENNNSNNNNYWGTPSKTDSWRLNNNNDSSWRPDRSHLSLNIRPSFV